MQNALWLPMGYPCNARQGSTASLWQERHATHVKGVNYAHAVMGQVFMVIMYVAIVMDLANVRVAVEQVSICNWAGESC